MAECLLLTGCRAAVTVDPACPLWRAPCDGQPAPDIVTAQGDLLWLAVAILVVGGLFLLLGLGRVACGKNSK